MLAANIDDMTGEAFGYLMERLMAEGALDVSFVPLTMKKSRPGLMAQVVARVEDEEKLGNLLLNESTTLGVRISHMRRMMQKRRFERVSTEYGEITVKIAEGTGRACPEYEQAAALARAAERCEAALYAAQSGMTPDAVVMDAEGAITALGEITGETVTESVVTRIFSDFCVGK